MLFNNSVKKPRAILGKTNKTKTKEKLLRLDNFPFVFFYTHVTHMLHTFYTHSTHTLHTHTVHTLHTSIGVGVEEELGAGLGYTTHTRYTSIGVGVEEELGAGLGYTTHTVCLVSSILGTPLRLSFV